ncbi:hypothetical protein MSIMFI_00483 [Mycobacterium simulans]|nr:hypothetical protein MSIMFI_00483 [Mycobacterium simulans]
MTITDPAVSAQEAAASSLFEITDHITIDFTEGARTVDLWCPSSATALFSASWTWR